MQLKGVFCLHIDNKTMQIVAQSYEFIYSRQIFFNKKVEFRTILPSLAQNIQFSFNNFAKRIVFWKLEKRKIILTFAHKIIDK